MLFTFFKTATKSTDCPHQALCRYKSRCWFNHAPTLYIHQPYACDYHNVKRPSSAESCIPPFYLPASSVTAGHFTQAKTKGFKDELASPSYRRKDNAAANTAETHQRCLCAEKNQIWTLRTSSEKQLGSVSESQRYPVTVSHLTQAKNQISEEALVHKNTKSTLCCMFGEQFEDVSHSLMSAAWTSQFTQAKTRPHEDVPLRRHNRANYYTAENMAVTHERPLSADKKSILSQRTSSEEQFDGIPQSPWSLQVLSSNSTATCKRAERQVKRNSLLSPRDPGHKVPEPHGQFTREKFEVNAEFVSSNAENILQKKHRKQSPISISSTASTPLMNAELIKAQRRQRPSIKALEDPVQKQLNENLTTSGRYIVCKDWSLRFY